MSRFFKSAAFPILIVIVLAFFASKLIQNGNQAPATDYDKFLTQIDDGQVDRVVLRTKDNSAEVTLKGPDKKRYTTGWVPGRRRRPADQQAARRRLPTARSTASTSSRRARA